MTENEAAKIIVDCAYKIHITLGPGLLESVYQKVLAYELEKRGLKVEQEVGMRIQYDDIVFDEGYRADLIVKNKVIVELKSIDALAPVHYKQLLSHVTQLLIEKILNHNRFLIRLGGLLVFL